MASTLVSASARTCGTKVVVVMVLRRLLMFVLVVMVVVVQEQDAHDVHDDADDCDWQRLSEVDRDRTNEPRNGLEPHDERDESEAYRARVSSEPVDLPGSEGERTMTGARSREPIRSSRQPERSDVRRHVEAVGKERHRTRELSHHKLDDRHCRRENHDPPGPGLAPIRWGTSRCVASGDASCMLVEDILRPTSGPQRETCCLALNEGAQQVVALTRTLMVP